MAGRKTAVVLGASIIALAGALGGWSIYRTRTPAYALGQTIEAIRARNTTIIEQNVDISRVGAGLTEAIFTGMMREFTAETGGDPMARGFATALFEELRPALEQEIAATAGQLLHPDDPQPPASRDLPIDREDLLSEFKRLFPLVGIAGRTRARESDDGVLIGVEFRHAELDTTLVLKLRLERPDKRWRVVALDNFVAYSDAVEEVMQLRLAEVNRPIEERFAAAIEIGELQRRTSANVWAMTETVTLGLEITNRTEQTISGVLLKGKYSAAGSESTFTLGTQGVRTIAPGESAVVSGRHEYRAWGADDLDRAIAQTSTGELQRNIIPHQIVFHDGERADTVRRFDSWGEFRAAQKR